MLGRSGSEKEKVRRSVLAIQVAVSRSSNSQKSSTLFIRPATQEQGLAWPSSIGYWKHTGARYICRANRGKDRSLRYGFRFMRRRRLRPVPRREKEESDGDNPCCG